MSETERAWAAGLFDGEGYIGFTKGKTTGCGVKIVIAQAGSPEVLHRFQAAVGVGKVTDRRDARVNAARQWQFVTTSKPDAETVMAAIWPYLSSVKRAQAKATLSVAKSIKESGISRRLTHCKRGHERTEANVILSSRACRECQKIHLAAYRAKPDVKARHAQQELARYHAIRAAAADAAAS